MRRFGFILNLLAVKRGRQTLIDVDSARRRIRNLPKANFRSPQSTTELVDSMNPQAKEAFDRNAEPKAHDFDADASEVTDAEAT